MGKDFKLFRALRLLSYEQSEKNSSFGEKTIFSETSILDEFYGKLEKFCEKNDRSILFDVQLAEFMQKPEC